MATLADRQVTEAFNGLLPSSYVCLGVITIGTVLFETFRRLKRPTRRLKTGQYAETAEDYSMAGYLYQSRTFEENTPERTVSKHGKWPLGWVWQVLQTENYYYVEHSSLDAASYVRVIRGCFYFVLAQALTVLPTLLAIHLHYSPDTYRSTDINRASLSALVSDANNTHLLWVHTLCLYWMSITWALTLFWIGHGIIKMRRKQLGHWARLSLDEIAKGQKTAQAHNELDRPINPRKTSEKPINKRGWRHRTLVVTNIPNDLRSESQLVEYFTEALQRLPDIADDTTPLLDGPEGTPLTPTGPTTISQAALPGLPAPESPKRDKRIPGSKPVVTRVILVRRTYELHETFRKREALLNDLEKAHIALANNALRAVSLHLKRIKSDAKKKGDLEKGDSESGGSEKTPKNDKVRPVDPLLVNALSPFLTPDDQPRTIWEVLRELPPAMLDEFQPLYRIRGRLFRGQTVPAIDYYLAKLNLTTAVLEDMRSSTDQIFASSPTAFVTFEDAQDARRLLRDLPAHPTRTWACRLGRAPDVRDIEWNKVVLTSFKGDVLRSFLVEAGIWLFIIFWVIPVTLLLGLVSVQNIAKVIPGLLNYFERNPNVKSLLTTLVPTVLLSILLFLVPTMLIQLSNRGQRFFTVSSLHHAVLARYWKFVFTDVVILFCVGTTAVESVFRDPGALLQASSLLNRIASAFPSGATFFVGYSILVCGIHNFFELMLMGFPFINHISVFLAKTPRHRYELALPRSNNVYYTLPNHLLILSIVFVFQILNPLVTAFNLIYFSLALVVFKRSFRQYYWVRNYQLDGKLIFNRFMRFSLDALMTGQVVVIALLWVSKQYKYGGACIPTLILTALFKLAATRAFSTYTSMQDVQEAYIIAGKPHKSSAVEVLRVPLAPTWLRSLPPLSRIAMRIKVNRHKEFDGFAKLESPRTSSGSTSVPASPLSEKSVPKVAGNSSPTLNTDNRKLPPTSIPSIVTDHPSLQRDDRTDFSAEYENPFLTRPLKNCLWLPRHPGYCVDLNDTVDYHGLALVSSGTEHSGAIGQWEQFATIPDPMDDTFDHSEILASENQEESGVAITVSSEEPLTEQLSLRTRSDTASTAGPRQRVSVASVTFARRSLNGSEQILTSPGVSDRAQTDGAINDRAFGLYGEKRSPAPKSPSQRLATSPMSMRRDERIASSGVSPSETTTLPGRPRAQTLSPPAVAVPLAASPPAARRTFSPPGLKRRSRSNLSGTSTVQNPTIMQAVSQDTALRELVIDEVQSDMSKVPNRKVEQEQDVEDEKRHENNIKSVTSSILRRVWPSVNASQW